MDDYDDINDRAEYLESIGLQLGWNRGLVKCQICHDRWHSWAYETCYDCKPPWLYYNRKEFSQDQRIDIMERDNYQCAACGTRDEYLQVDHIMPCMRGGEADVWNGQTLCAPCNFEKAGRWQNTQWPKKRNELIDLYLTFGWPYLSYEERDLLVAEASNKREITGYHAFSGWWRTAELETIALQYKVVINQTTPKVRFADTRLLLIEEQGPVPEFINVVDGQREERRTFDHGPRFFWHAHVTEPPPPPQWAVEMAEQW